MTSLEDSLYPLIWANRIMGQATIRLKSRFSPIKLSILYIIIVLIAYISMIYYKLTRPLTKDSVPLISLLFKAILVANIIAATISTIFGYIHNKQLESFKTRIKLVDETLETFGINPRYDIARKKNLTIILLWMVIGLMEFIYSTIIYKNIYHTIFGPIMRATVFQLPQSIISSIEANFIAKILALGRRFKRTNALVQNTVNRTSKIPQCNEYADILNLDNISETAKFKVYNKNRNDIEYLLATTRQLHLDLCSIARLVNNAYGKQLALQSVSNFILVIGYTYSSYFFLTEPQFPLYVKIWFTMYLLLRVSFCIIRIISIIKICVDVATEANKTSQITQEIQTSDDKIRDEIHQYSLQIMQNPLCFTAAGFFKLDFAFVQTFFGAIATYLIIMIQYRSNIEEATENIVAT